MQHIASHFLSALALLLIVLFSVDTAKGMNCDPIYPIVAFLYVFIAVTIALLIDKYN